ncbi:MAG TPA: GntR family transcriptional regulator [Spirochaetia bacterium]|nr:GntR family transcriptional regulator [Spirochaetia bacterium]
MKNELKTIDKNSAIPAYYQLAKIFEESICQGELKPEEALPPEHNIAAQYEISRMTVRQAIAELVAAGLVYTMKGKGTYVAKPAIDNVAFELRDFYTEIRKRGLVPAINLLQARILKADEELASKLSVPPGTRCLFYRFTLSAEGEHLAYETKYVVYAKQKPFLEVELKDPSLSNLVAAYGDKMPVTCKRILQAAMITPQEAGILEVPADTPVFLVEQTLYDLDKKPVGWGKSVYRGDRCKLTSYEGWHKEDFYSGMVRHEQ